MGIMLSLQHEQKLLNLLESNNVQTPNEIDFVHLSELVGFNMQQDQR